MVFVCYNKHQIFYIKSENALTEGIYRGMLSVLIRIVHNVLKCIDEEEEKENVGLRKRILSDLPFGVLRRSF